MVVGPDYVYIAMPRAASQSMWWWLAEFHDGEVVPNRYHTSDIPEKHKGKRVFTVVRNPYDRLCSLYALAQSFWPFEKYINVRQTNGMTLAQFVYWCNDRLETKWRSQAEILGRLEAEVLRFEDLPHCLGGVFPGNNVSQFPRIGASLVTPGVRQYWLREFNARRAVEEHSAEDFVRFGYGIQS
jgi:hypothetical protein